MPSRVLHNDVFRSAIADGGTESTAVEVGQFTSGSVQVPATDSTSFDLEISIDKGVNWTVLSEQLTPVADEVTELPDTVFGGQMMRLVGNTAEAAEREVLIFLRG